MIQPLIHLRHCFGRLGHTNRHHLCVDADENTKPVPSSLSFHNLSGSWPRPRLFTSWYRDEYATIRQTQLPNIQARELLPKTKKLHKIGEAYDIDAGMHLLARPLTPEKAVCVYILYVQSTCGCEFCSTQNNRLPTLTPQSSPKLEMHHPTVRSCTARARGIGGTSKCSSFRMKEGRGHRPRHPAFCPV